MKTPTTIITGFLGSGKTTLIRGMLSDLSKENKKVIYIKNEVGETDIDGQLLKKSALATKELLNGCICCTLVGPFLHAIDELLATYHTDHIIIETSGAADPSSIALSVSGHPRLVRDGVIAVIDAVHFKGFEDLSETAKAQAHFTDIIVLNKGELADMPTKRAVVGYIRELNETAPIIEAKNGYVPLPVLLGATGEELEKKLAQHHDEHGNEDHNHIENDEFEAFTLTFPPVSSLNALDGALAQIPSNIFRVKGLISTPSGTILLNRVGVRSTYEPIPLQTNKTSLVFIGFRAKTVQAEVEKLMSGL